MGREKAVFQECEFCQASVRLENIPEHLQKVHKQIRNDTKAELLVENIVRESRALRERGRLGKARKTLKKALKIRSDDDKLWDEYAGFCWEMEDIKGTLDALERCIELAPSNVKYVALKGLIYFSENRYEDSWKCYEEVLRREPSHLQAWYHMAAILYYKEDYEKALEYLDKALELNDEYYMAWFTKFQILEHLGRSKEAYECFEKANRLNPVYVFRALQAQLEGAELIHTSSMKVKEKKCTSSQM